VPTQAVVAGHICLDLLPDLMSRRLDLTPGALRVVGPMTVAPGGSVSNTGLALHRLGVASRLVARIGEDPLGTVLRGALENESAGLGDGLVVRLGEGTSYSVLLASAETDRIVIHYPGANDGFSATDVEAEQLRGAELLHLGYPPLLRRLCKNDGLELLAVMRTAHAAGLATSMDMCEPDDRIADVSWPALLARVLPEVDVFMPSFGELRAMLSDHSASTHLWEGASLPAEDEIRGLAERALELGATVAGVKLGRFGLYLRTSDATRLGRLAARLPGLDAADWANRELWAPVFDVEVAGTTGSGDTTIAGFLAALLDRRSPSAALNLACAVGSLCVQAPDALSGIADRAAAEERAASDLNRPRPPLSRAWTGPVDGVLAGPRDQAGV